MRYPILKYIFLSFAVFTPLSAQEVIPYPPTYYKETPFGIEWIEELPRDTVVVRDTVYVSDLDGFLSRFVGREVDLNRLVRDVAGIEALIDSLEGVSQQALFYNYFLGEDPGRNLSRSFIVREFSLDGRLRPASVETDTTGKVPYPQASREIMFRCDGTERTLRFIRNREAIRRFIVYMFTMMQEDEQGIAAVNLYFPDYNFTGKRAMTQMVKSVRMMMDASRDFKHGPTTLRVIFHSQDPSVRAGSNFVSGLLQEASEVVFVDGVDVRNNFFVRAVVNGSDSPQPGLWGKIVNHVRIARYYTGPLDIDALDLTVFEDAAVGEILSADYRENNWEVFLYIILLIIAVVIAVYVLYCVDVRVSELMTSHMESVLLLITVVVLEIGVLLITMFQNMCREDEFSIVDQHPVLIFMLPLAVVFVMPVLHRMLANRKKP
ncbi:MAG: hypothetical protein LUE26_01405 [Alistipes sp.]|nr:hypothetical protein [Alistipes sp.]